MGQAVGWCVGAVIYINHITLNTGHTRRSPRAEVSGDTIEKLQPWLNAAINTGSRHPLPAPGLGHISAVAMVDDGALVVTVYAPSGPHEHGKPHAGATMPLVTIGVAKRSRQSDALWGKMVKAFGSAPNLRAPAIPWCAVALHAGMLIYPSSLDWIGDFERCVAWTWME